MDSRTIGTCGKEGCEQVFQHTLCHSRKDHQFHTTSQSTILGHDQDDGDNLKRFNGVYRLQDRATGAEDNEDKKLRARGKDRLSKDFSRLNLL